MGVSSRTNCFHGKAIRIAYYECSSFLRRILLWPVWLYHVFPRYRMKGTMFGGKELRTKCVFYFSTSFFETFLILRRIQRDIMIKIHKPSDKVPVIPVRF